MGSVSRIYQTEDEFVADLAVSGFRLSFAAKTRDLAKGASLTALKNQWVREVRSSHGDIIDRSSLNDAAREAVVLLRDQIEDFFAEKE